MPEPKSTSCCAYCAAAVTGSAAARRQAASGPLALARKELERAMVVSPWKWGGVGNEPLRPIPQKKPDRARRVPRGSDDGRASSAPRASGQEVHLHAVAQREALGLRLVLD